MNFIKSKVEGGCVTIGGTKLDVTQNLGKFAKDYEGKEIYFGFRPEAISLGKKDNAYVLDAKVELTEMLGDNTNVYVNIGADNAILKVTPYEAPNMDDDIVFSIPVESTYLFDAETEFVIDPQAEAAKV
jgi:multiple sugar transport system ATP-binding protein